jgi:uncharacterized protein (DUF2147 family)
MYKINFLLMVSVLVIAHELPAHSSIEGLWASQDGKRVYKIQQSANNTYEAVLFYTKKPGGTISDYVLKNVTYNLNRKSEQLYATGC